MLVGLMNQTATLYKSRTMSKKERKKTQDSDCIIEGILAEYKVSNTGSMQRINECPLKMGRNFIPSQNGNMVMVRSRDKSKITIVNFDKDHPQGLHFKMLAFTTKLKAVPLNDALNVGMSKYYTSVKDRFDVLVEVSLVGRSKYAQMVYIESVSRDLQE